MSQYKFEMPRMAVERTPIKPFIGKLPMKMEFIDSFYQVFELNKLTNKLEFMYQTFPNYAR